MILQVNKMYYPEIGGVETVVKQYSEYLQKYDDVVVLCVNKKFSTKTTIEVINGIKVYRCASLGTYMSMPVSITFFWYLLTLAKRADIIHFHEPFPLGSIGSLFIDKSKKIFVTWHSDIIKQKRLKRIVEFFQKKLCMRADKIITTSNRMIESSIILKNFKDKILVIPLSLNKKNYFRDYDTDNIDSSLLDLPKDYVMFFGRLSYYKGINVLLEAIYMINKDIPFLIAGTGELNESVRNKVKKTNKKIYFINREITEDEKMYLLKNSKFIVFPSIYPSEAFGIVQLEAMIYSKPVINTNLSTGVPWVSLNDISGLTVEPSDARQLAKAIEKLYFDEKLYNRLSKGAFERYNKYFDSEVTNKILYELYYKNMT
ncbi:glycosyltransferase [Thermoanaerobacterium thermosaccharolyticum]|uniref:glycosyltransferase n=1 Tax=Thermoanaerobacterium thermosaccharolyticum TaxID=1517 RepID=UPI0020A4F30F|nr:glycosyltransferase [Thermoanaerobacterium thermosaccharolyticum]MCP2241259.1 rhamnosyl/mannosyltransferase [Thermoanaerobacterium thermosaccharolyticum]